MKRNIIVISMLCAASAAWATIVTDDFGRADTAKSTDTSLIGVHWNDASSVNTWRIGNNTVYAGSVDPMAMMYNDELQTLNGSGNSFDLSLDVAGRAANVWSGVVFNYNNSSNYYTIRIKAETDDYQILARRSNNTWKVMKTGNASSNFVAHRFYTINVTSDTAHTYDFTITDTTSSTVVGSETGVVDNESLYSGGYAGLALYSQHATNEYGRYDNFSLETIPEPATLGMVAMLGGAIFFIRKRFMI